MNARTMLALALALTVGAALGVAGESARAQSPDPPDAGPSAPDPGWGRGAGGPGMRGPGMERRMRRADLLRELDLSKEQRDKIAELRDKQQRSTIRARADLQTARLDLRRLIRADKPDRAAIDRQIDRMAQIRSEMQKSRVAMMLDMRSVLTPEQLEKARSRW
ncbi:MAG TPA: Spy/CpxP family protein refolding chaperone [Candidatus Eisenbacteria bacterium]